ncbi:MAG: outer membrane protein assembly factor BamA [Planctomycetes bacterium]|nr:outer membrane protein assembly factor BamA [Planctomycetota bacterium]
MRALVLGLLAICIASCATRSTYRRDPSAQEPQPYTVQAKFYGAHSVSERTLQRTIEDYLLDLSLEHEKSTLAVDATLDLEDLYRSRGFPDVQIAHRFERDEAKRELAVVFEITEGPQVTASMTLRGNEAFSANRLVEFWVRTNADVLGIGDPLFVRGDVESFAASLEMFYKTQGYLDVTVTPPQIAREPGATSAEVSITIDEGRPYRIGEVTIGDELAEALGSESTEAIRSLAGSVASSTVIESARTMALSRLRSSGHPTPLVRLGVTADVEGRRIDVRVFGDPDRRGRIVEIEVEGQEQTAEWYIRNQIAFAEGDWFDGTAIDRTRRDIYLTGLFQTVEIDHEWIDEERLRMTIRVVEEDSRSVDLLAGYGSYEHYRGMVRFEERNVFGTGRRFAVEGRASTKGTRAAATITDPHFLGSRTRLTLGADVFEREEPSFTDRARGLTAALARDLGGGFKARIGYSYREHNGSDIDPLTNLEDYTQGNVFTEFKFDRRDSILYPRSGFLCELQLDADDPSFGSDVQFTRARFTASAYVPIHREIHLALRASTGALWPGMGSDRIPLQERFFNGGESSVRSFRESRLGPRDATGSLVGGEFRNVFTAELRVPLRRLFEAALFMDAGNVGSDVTTYGLNGLRYAIGAGLRIRLPIGPVRVDGAFNPQRDPGEDEWVVHLSVGYPF